MGGCGRRSRKLRMGTLKVINLHEMDRWRRTGADIVNMFGTEGNHLFGMFIITVDGAKLKIIASAVDGWDHVSVSTPTRCPTWEEMEFVKRRFFKPHETAMQLHVPLSEHINNHPYCLHLWRPHHADIPRPPSIMVGL